MCKNTDGLVHLHSHDQNSWDTFGSPLELLTSAKNNGQHAMALTNHGNLSGIITFTQTAKRLGMKPLVGNEAYIDAFGHRTHLTLLAMNNVGYNNLVTLHNRGVQRAVGNPKSSKRDLQFHPTLYEDLLKYHEGLIVLSGCPASIFNYSKKDDAGIEQFVYTTAQASALLNELKGVYEDRLFVEAMLHSDVDSELGRYLERSLDLSSATGIPLVVTNDIHFADKKQRIAHEYYTKANHGFSYQNEDLYVKSRNEMEYTLAHSGMSSSDVKKLQDAMTRTIEIADRITPVDFSGKPQLPFINDSEKQFVDAVWAGYERHVRLGVESDEYYEILKEQLEYEIKIVIDKGFPTYFLMTKEFIDVAKSGGHASSEGRGSAGGFSVSYMLGITGVDPIKYGLIAERFLSPDRDGMPDIDLDFSGSGRDAIIEYAREKYGAYGIITNNTYGFASLVRQMAKYFHVSDNDRNEILAKGRTSDAWGRVTKANKDWDVIYDSLLGKIKHHGKHAGGIVIDPDDSPFIMPIETGANGIPLAAYSEGTHGSDLSDAKYVKFDILAVSSLTQVQMCKELSGEEPPVLEPYEWNDAFGIVPKIPLTGIFQLSGYTASNLSKEFPPKNIFDVGLILALGRTGAMDAGTTSAYVKHRKPDNFPEIRGLLPLDDGNMIKVRLDTGLDIHVYDHFQVWTDKGWITFADLVGDEEIII